MELGDLDPDPIRELTRWLAQAAAAELPLHDAFALATSDADGSPSVRFVLLRGLGEDGLRWFTNRASRKGRDVASNPRAAAAFWWPQLDRQVRVAGPVQALDDDVSIAYWRTRPRGSQLSASASQQGEPIGSVADLQAAVADLAQLYHDEVPLPPSWGGYLLIPERFEFWMSREDRLHDRIEYLREGVGWRRRRLQP